VTNAIDSRRALVEATLEHLLTDGRPEDSLRSIAKGIGVSHSLLLYHFGSTAGLLGEVHLAGERRQRELLGTVRLASGDTQQVMRSMWKHLARAEMWDLYRLGFALRVRADVAHEDQQAERDQWIDALAPVIDQLGLSRAQARNEALLWIATCRGLLWELVTGADPAAVNRAANRFFAHYDAHVERAPSPARA
jgi:AcrR family transcriptional regulator